MENNFPDFEEYEPHEVEFLSQQNNFSPMRNNRSNHLQTFQLTLVDKTEITQDNHNLQYYKTYLDKKDNHDESETNSEKILYSEEKRPYISNLKDKDAEIRGNLLKEFDHISFEDDIIIKTKNFFVLEKSLSESGRNLLVRFLPKVVDFMEKDEENNILGLHLSWHKKNGLYLNMQPISADFLIYYLMEDTMHLFKDHAIDIAAHNGENSSYLLKIVEYLSRNQIHAILKQKTLDRLAHLRSCRKTGQHMAKDIKTFFQTIILDLLAFGLCKGFIKKKDIHFLMLQQPGSFFLLKELFSRDKYLRLEQQLRIFPSNPYLPWIVVIKRSLLQFTSNHKEFLTQNEELTRRCLASIIRWLNLPSKRALITWLFQFFFRDSSYAESKRQFLFIQGDTNLGKTAFIQILLSDPNFLTEFLTTQYFSSYKQGEFDLHCLIFDDPTPLSSTTKRNQLLHPEFFLNLSRYDKTGRQQHQHSINVKNGYMLINKGQVCLISNHPEEKLFSTKYLPTMRTRLLKMTFSKHTPFPLQFNSAHTKPFVFHNLESKDINLLLSCHSGTTSSELFSFPSHSHSSHQRSNDDKNSFYTDEDDVDHSFPLSSQPNIKKAIEKDKPHPRSRKKFCSNSHHMDIQSSKDDNEEEVNENELTQEEQIEIVTDPNLTPQLAFFYLWVAILKIFQHQILYQDPLTLKLFIPHADFRDLLLQTLNGSQQTLYSFLQTISDNQLLQFVGCDENT